MRFNASQHSIANAAEYWKALIETGILARNGLFQPSFAFHIETSRLICTANQVTGFYMKCNTGLKWVKRRLFQCMVPKTMNLVKTVDFYFSFYLMVSNFHVRLLPLSFSTISICN